MFLLQKAKLFSCKIWVSNVAIVYADYIPEVLIKDYGEASGIIQLRPKASATLSRRCLQG
jgi:hypothetical protein